jgi:hypothetical protein
MQMNVECSSPGGQGMHSDALSIEEKYPGLHNWQDEGEETPLNELYFPLGQAKQALLLSEE